uniref:C2H2-type domain-containing protein n=1 Tax=Bursaphelenchus xylophilus TaxID=6326 RepID=A0A1I7S7N4_BURXY
MAQFGFKESELFAAFAKFANPASGDENQETFSRSLSPELRPEDLKMEMDENENCNNEMKFDDNLTAELFKSVGQVDGSSTPGKSNGYRAELKRPDLKGQFRCTICNKVFCHSSSLSRHRMQAHFKSYTCTLCSKEITSQFEFFKESENAF